MPTPAIESAPEVATTPEAAWPVGTVAVLAAPFPVDRGLWTDPRLVDRFTKTSNLRWTSTPGNDISYPTLGALALDAPVVQVITPPGTTPQPTRPPEPEEYPMVTIAGPDELFVPTVAPDVPVIVEEVPLAPAMPKWLLLAAVGIGAWLLLKGRR